MILGENYVELTSNGNELVVVAVHIERQITYAIFYNGALTSMRVPGVHHKKNKTPKWVYENIVYGPGKYNQKLMADFFREIIPEEFL